MNAKGGVTQFGDKWLAHVTNGEGDDSSYHESPYFKTEAEARVAVEYVAWTLWAAMVEWE